MRQGWDEPQHLRLVAGRCSVTLDLNEDLVKIVVDALGYDRAIFITTNVTEMICVSDVIHDSMIWIRKTGNEPGGVVAAAGVGKMQTIVTTQDR